jgi:predicted GIY-YIG superfamily endonuclease
MKQLKGFTKRYDVTSLVWYEVYGDINDAIAREKNLMRWQRAWKLRIIEEMNPEWPQLQLHFRISIHSESRIHTAVAPAQNRPM